MNEVENLVQVCPRINFLNVNHPIPHISASDSKIAANYHVYCGASAVDVVDDCNKFVRQYLSLGVERSVPYEDVIDAVTTVFSHLSIHNAEYDLNLRHLGSIVAEVERTTSKYAEMVNYRAAIIDAFMRIPGVVECSIFCDQKSLDHYLLHLAGSCELIDCKLETVTFSSACISNQPDNYRSGLFLSNLDDLTVTGQLSRTMRGSMAIVGLGSVSDENICLIVVSEYVDFFGKRLDRLWFDRWQVLYDVAVKNVAALEIANAEYFRLEKLYHFYNSLSEGEELAVSAKTESDLMNGMCQRIVASDVILSAWIARPDQEGRFKLIASRGAGVKTLKVFELSTSRHSDTTIYERAWRDRKVHFNNDYLDDPDMSAWRDFFQRFKWRSAAAVPIFKGDQIDSVLVVVSPISGLFDEETLELVERFGRLTGAALQAMAHERGLKDERQRALEVAQRDYLTGLPNRLHLDIHMPKVLARAKRYGHLVGVVVMDLDGFKPVNDNFGHEVGDIVLQATAARLAQAARKSDFVARSGGDEFVIVFDDLKNREGLSLALTRVKALIEVPIVLPGGEVLGVSASMGATLFPYDDSSSGTLLRHADAALYRVKQEPPLRTTFFREYSKTWERTQALPKRGARGLDNKFESGLIVYYQPIVAPTSGKTIRLEALARIKSGDELLDPKQFLPRLSPKQVMRLSLIVCDRVLEQLREWEDNGVEALKGIAVSVNMLPESFLEPSLCDTIKTMLAKYNLPAHRLYLEVLETGEFLSLSQARETIGSLRNLGVRISLDDLGSAYAGLLRLRDLLFDEVKLDKSFVQTLAQNPRDLRFIRSVQVLVDSLGIDLVVEGVEDLDTLTALHFLGVPLVQGFIFERALPPQALVEFCASALPISTARLKAGQWLGAYAGRIIWDESVVKRLKLEPERLNADNLMNIAKCQLTPVMATDSLLDELHKREHELVSQFIKSPYDSNRNARLLEITEISSQALERIEELLSSRVASQ